MIKLHISEDAAHDWLQRNCGWCRCVGDPMWMDVQCPVARAIVWYGGGFSDAVLADFHAYGYPGKCGQYVLDEFRFKQYERWCQEEAKKAARKRPWLEKQSAG